LGVVVLSRCTKQRWLLLVLLLVLLWPPLRCHVVRAHPIFATHPRHIAAHAFIPSPAMEMEWVRSPLGAAAAR
jgi:hypothetical protein